MKIYLFISSCREFVRPDSVSELILISTQNSIIQMPGNYTFLKIRSGYFYRCTEMYINCSYVYCRVHILIMRIY
jgi:hypothetical protein